jgi:hypothetical protein
LTEIIRSRYFTYRAYPGCYRTAYQQRPPDRRNGRYHCRAYRRGPQYSRPCGKYRRPGHDHHDGDGDNYRRDRQAFCHF